MSSLVIENFKGGYSTNDSRNLENNQLEQADNVIYNEAERLETALGYAAFGNNFSTKGMTSMFYHKMSDGTRVLIGTEGRNLRRYNESTNEWDLVSGVDWLTEYDGRVVLDSCDESSGWTGSDDATSVTQDTTEFKQGDGSVRFKLDTSASGADQAVLTKTIASIDLSASEDTGSIRLWGQIPSPTNFTEFELRWGSNSSNYWSQTANQKVDGGGLAGGATTWNFLDFDWATATQTGSPDASAITYVQIIFKYNSGYGPFTPGPADPSNAGIDFIAFYPSDDSQTSQKTRWDFAVYKDAIGMTNGVDPYCIYDPLSNDNFNPSGGPGGRYIEYLQDRLFIGGDDLFPHRLSYTDANPTNLDENRFTNAVEVGADDSYRINVIREIGQSIVVGKNTKSYNVDVANTQAFPIDSTEGMFNNRTGTQIGNGILYQSRRGVEQLQTKRATTGQYAVETEELSDSIKELMQQVSFNSLNLGASIYVKSTASWFYSFDTNNDTIPDTTVVYSARPGVRAFTKRNFPSIYDYTEYETAEGNIIYLFSLAVGGQVYQFETGIDDDGIKIESTIATKEFDFGMPELYKYFESVYIIGDKTENGEIIVQILIDGEVVSEKIITDAFSVQSNAADTIGTSEIGTESIGGSSSALDQFFKIKIPLHFRGSTIQVKMMTGATVTRFSPERMTIIYENEGLSYFDFNNIA